MRTGDVNRPMQPRNGRQWSQGMPHLISTRRESMYPLRMVVLSILVVVVSACGGGGSSSSVPLRVSTTSVTRTAAVNETRPIVVLALSIDGAFSGAYLSSQFSKGGIGFLTPQFASPTSATVVLAFRMPAELAPGAYQDEIVLRLCRDFACAQIVGGSEVTIGVTYNVTKPAPGNEPTIQFGAAAVAHSDRTINGLPSSPVGIPGSVRVPYMVSHAASVPHVKATANSLNGVYAVEDNFYDNGFNGAFVVRFKGGGEVGVGRFHDTITVTACLDEACVNPITGSPFTFPAELTVSNTEVVEGVNGFVWNPAMADASRLAWSETNQRLIGITTLWSRPDPSSLVSIDPLTQAVDWVFPLSASPTAVAVSEDGLYAYVGLVSPVSLPSSVEKIRLSDRAIVSAISVGDYQFIDEIQVAPNRPDLIAVATQINYTERAVQLIDMASGATSVYAVTPNSAGSYLSLAWGDSASTLYAYDVSDDKLLTFHPSDVQLGAPTVVDVDLNGVHASNSYIARAGSLLIESHGGVFDLATQQANPRIYLPPGIGDGPANPGNSTLAVDTVNNRVYFRYSAASFTSLSVFEIPSMRMVGTTLTAGSNAYNLVRWGRDGLAYPTDAGHVGIVTGPFVVP